ncbi:MAG: DUF3060 domain-containing protein [Micropruina sp.]|nr:DUF3060 domain-containing protein [Micropruina sp.]
MKHQLTLAAALVFVLSACTGPSTPTTVVTPPGTPVPATSEVALSPSPGDATATPSRQEQLEPGASTCVAGTRYNVNRAGNYRLSGPCEVVAIGADRADVDITGAVGSLTVNGQRNEVDAGDIAEITISGDDNDVEARKVTGVQVQGQRNAVDAFSIETVTVVGDRNELDGGARIGVVTVNGNSNEFEAREIGTRNDTGSRNRFETR